MKLILLRSSLLRSFAVGKSDRVKVLKFKNLMFLAQNLD